MKVGIICSAADGGKSGISIYIKNVVKAMSKGNREHSLVLFRFREDSFVSEGIEDRFQTVFISSCFNKPLLSILWHLFILPFIAMYYRLDTVFLPAGNRRLSFWCPCRVVATVHDISQLHIKGKYDGFRMFYATKVLPWLMGRVDRIIAISKSTMTDIVEHAHISPEKISIVYNGIDTQTFRPLDSPEARERLKLRYGIDSPYVLYVSRIEYPGKNHCGLIEAFAELLKTNDEYKSFKLVLSGAPWAGSEPVFDLVKDLNIEDNVIFTGFADKSDLPVLYSCASCFALPSHFEGFGLPLLEAMACHTPVICANTSSLPEVAGNAALFFDPHSTKEIKDALIKVLGNKLARDELVAKGKLRIDEFSWESTGMKTFECLYSNSEGNELWTSAIGKQ
jgi:glycosyltransferase involved in cell wall biosynthesis